VGEWSDGGTSIFCFGLLADLFGARYTTATAQVTDLHKEIFYFLLA
jgi:hypothetical protein